MGHASRQREAEAALRDQENLLPRKQLILTFVLLALTLLVYFIDQNGIGQVLPTMAIDLNATRTITWAGTSALIGNTTFQVLYGRLSDLFGRKMVYLSAIALLAVSDLLCGLSQDAVMLYVFRGMAGIAGGGITSMTMTIVSDIVTLQERGKYQGILGSCVGLGNMIGPLIAAAFAEKTKVSWRGLFYLLAPTAVACGVMQFFMLPNSMPKGDFRANLRKIDYLGTITASVALILILIPVSGGGSYFEWSSPMVISMLTIGSIFAVLFIIVEWRISSLPMIPLTLFKNMAISAVMAQSFFFGLVYYSYIYFLPLYFQNVRQYSPLRSAVLTIPLVLMQAVSSSLSGQYISRTGRYGEIIFAGFLFFAIGVSLTTLFDQHIPVRYIVAILIVLGWGNGGVFQPTIVALQAHARKSQRAVVISIRNFLRNLGGAIGLAIGSALLQNKLKDSLPQGLKYLAASAYARPDYGTLSAGERAAVIDAYTESSRAVFIMMSAFAGICLITCLFVRDHGLVRPDEREAMEIEKAERERQVAQEIGAHVETRDVEKGQLPADVHEAEESELAKQSVLDEVEHDELLSRPALHTATREVFCK